LPPHPRIYYPRVSQSESIRTALRRGPFFRRGFSRPQTQPKPARPPRPFPAQDATLAEIIDQRTNLTRRRLSARARLMKMVPEELQGKASPTWNSGMETWFDAAKEKKTASSNPKIKSLGAPFSYTYSNRHEVPSRSSQPLRCENKNKASEAGGKGPFLPRNVTQRANPKMSLPPVREQHWRRPVFFVRRASLSPSDWWFWGLPRR